MTALIRTLKNTIPLVTESVSCAPDQRLALYADEVLSKLSRIPHLSDSLEATSLQQELCMSIQAFEAKAKLGGVPALKVLTARYILCAVLDEAILQSTWGQDQHWVDYGLLSLFHNDTWGGEQFFALVNKALQEPKFNIDLLELMYISLTLGFQGQYRIQPDGINQLKRLQQELWHLLQLHYPTQQLILIKPQDIKSYQKSPWLRRGFMVLAITAITIGVYGFFYQSLLNTTLAVAQHAATLLG